MMKCVVMSTAAAAAVLSISVLAQAPINGRFYGVLPSPWHLYYQNIEQINGCRNNMFASIANVGACVNRSVAGACGSRE